LLGKYPCDSHERAIAVRTGSGVQRFVVATSSRESDRQDRRPITIWLGANDPCEFIRLFGPSPRFCALMLLKERESAARHRSTIEPDLHPRLLDSVG
jgi:hypothetical protein